ncbi:MAG: ATP-binding protein [Betaproteobacteria bacterium]|nr:ATP-binding protein [Betaproteobacteria bacterium]
MESLSNRQPGLLTTVPVARVVKYVDYALIAALVVTLASGCYLAYVFFSQLGSLAEFAYFSNLRETIDANLFALGTLALLAGLRIALLFIEPGRLIKQLSVWIVGPILLGLLVSYSLLALMTSQLRTIDESAIPETEKVTEQLLSNLINTYRLETFGFVMPLAAELIDMLERNSLLRTGFRLENAVENYSLTTAGIIDSNGLFIISAPLSEKAGSTPEPPLAPRELTALGAQVRGLRSPDLEEFSYFRLLADDGEAIPQSVRVVIPLGEFTLSSETEPLLLLIESRIPESLTEDITALSAHNRDLNRKIALRTGLFEIFFQLTLNSTVIIVSAALVLASRALRTHGLRLRKLARMMDSIAHEKAGSGLPLPQDTGSDEISMVTESFREMTKKRDALLHDLTANQTFLNGVLENIDAAVIVLDSRLQIRSMNRRCLEVLGKMPLTGEELTSFTRRLDTNDLDALIESGKYDAPASLTINGRNLMASVTRLPHNIGGGRIIVFADISAPLAEQNLQAWTEALQRFLHEVKNPLQPLLLTAEQLERRLKPELSSEKAAYLHDKIDAMIQGINSIVKVTNSLRAFTGQQPARYLPVDINRAAKNAQIRHSNENFTIELDLQDGCTALFDKDLIARTFDNLLINAWEAALEAGLEKVTASISTCNEGEQVHISVLDNAGGINPEQLPQVFRPHISFKKGGSGLGLAHVKGMILAAGGNIEADNDGSGTRFTIVLPMADKEN